ncbi:hypothetical protein [Kineococcus terrestris]|uniref:hypothetical protein n=1 Tax=Kineococcus terrestris TaxID=2044856 RepID=UPI0034DB3AE0
MSTLRSDPVVSGEDYVVEEVGGRPPRDLDDFTGETVFRLSRGALGHEVVGLGTAVDGAVRVFEKDGSPGGKDVRVWRVRRDDDGFRAVHTAP